MPESNSRSLTGDGQKLRDLRQSLGWTQELAATKTGYTSRLIRKLESGGSVRPDTFVNILQCYHEALDANVWDVSDFLLTCNNARREIASGSAKNSADYGHDQISNLERTKLWYELVFNQRKSVRANEFFADDVLYVHSDGEPSQGVDVIQQLVDSLISGFDPIQMTFEKIFEHDNVVYTFWHVSMQHVGEFGGVSATGRWVKFRGNSSAKYSDGKIVEAIDQWPVYDVIRQLQDGPTQWF